MISLLGAGAALGAGMGVGKGLSGPPSSSPTYVSQRAMDSCARYLEWQNRRNMEPLWKKKRRAQWRAVRRFFMYVLWTAFFVYWLGMMFLGMSGGFK